MRVLISGPPASGKSTLAAAVAEHFRIPHLELSDEDLNMMASRLSSKVCRYRGYVLNAGNAGFAEVEKLFCKEPPAIDEAAIDEEIDQGDEPPTNDEELDKVDESPVIDAELCPAFVIVTQAPEALCRARWQRRGTGILDQFKYNMDQYINANLT